MSRRQSLGRDFRLLWTAGAASSFGDSLSGVSVLLLALLLTNDPAFAGLVGSVSLITKVTVSLPSGWLADRVPRKAVCVIGQLFSAAVMGAFAILIATHHATGASLLVFAVVSELPYEATGAALTGATARLVAPEKLTFAMSRMQVREQASTTAGPAIGGALFAVAPWLPIAIDAGTFVFSGALISRIRGRMDAPKSSAPAHRGMLVGLKHFAQPGFARSALIWLVPLSVAGSAGFFLVVIALRTHGGSASAIGAITAASGVAGIIGSLLAPRLVRPGREFRICLLMTVVTAVVLMGLAARPTDFPVAVALSAALALVGPPAQIVLGTRLLMETPPAIQGRVFAAFGLVMQLAVALGILAVGSMASSIGASDTLMFGSLLVCAGGAVLVASRHTRSWPQPEPPGSPSPAREPVSV